MFTLPGDMTSRGALVGATYGTMGIASLFMPTLMGLLADRFINAERVLGRVADLLRQQPDRRQLILSLEESFDLDSTALDALIEFDALMRARGIALQLARVRDHVRDLMQAAGATDLIARSSYSVDDAVQALKREKK